LLAAADRGEFVEHGEVWAKIQHSAAIMRLRWTTPATQDFCILFSHIQQDILTPPPSGQTLTLVVTSWELSSSRPQGGLKAHGNWSSRMPYIVVYRIQIKTWRFCASTTARKTALTSTARPGVESCAK